MIVPASPVANPAETHRLVGYSAWTPDRILAAVLGGQSPAEIPGDFVLATRLESDDGAPAEDVIISSAVAAHPYYFIHRDGRLHHGQDVFALVREAGLPWRWNPRTVACLAWLGHAVGEDTLHPDVRRVPPCSVLRHSAGRLSVRQDQFWETLLEGPRRSPGEVAGVLENVLDELLGDRPLVSLSAGFDSRLILARAMAAGVRVQALTMGSATSTDRRIAALIAADQGIPHHVVELDPAGYLAAAETVTRITGGVKTAANWHTYLYTINADAHGAVPHIVGANGEFARTFYLNKGSLARLGGTAGANLVRAYFTSRIERRRRRFARDLPELGTNRFQDSSRLAEQIVDLVGTTGSGLSQLDRFYATQRVRHFIGNGLALYQRNIPTVSPFLDSRWIRAAARMPRAERLGDNFHRLVIHRNSPRLLEYPTGYEKALARRAEPGYWIRRRPTVVGYSPFAQILDDPQVHAAVIEEPGLDELFPRPRREAAVRARVPHVIDLLLTLGHAARVAHDAAGTGGQDVLRRKAGTVR